LLFNVYIGIRFFLFVRSFETAGTTISVSRPPSVEAYLPIAALISLKHLIVNRIFDPVHPAALIIFLAISVSAVLLRRGFCSWICPIGTVSELTYKLGDKVATNLRPYRFIDIPLRSLKYLVLGFFFYAILNMSGNTVQAFIDSPFNKLADVRMLMFFTNPSSLTITVLIGFFLMSLVIKNFWCRYLCPYGALLGLLSKTGLVRVERNEKTCIDCHKCEDACPSYIKVTKSNKVTSTECTMCAECVMACQETQSLSLKTVAPRTRIATRVYGLVLVGGFLVFILIAQIAGYWQTNITQAEYSQRIPAAANPEYGHP